MNKQKIEKAKLFELVDLNKDGLISKNELKTLLYKLKENVTESELNDVSSNSSSNSITLII